MMKTKQYQRIFIFVVSTYFMCVMNQDVLANTKLSYSDPLAWPNPCKIENQETSTTSSERMPPLSTQQMTESQKIAASTLASGPRGCIFGPFSVLLRSPEFLNRAQILGEYLRFHSALPAHLREMTMLIVGKEWNQPYIWYIHEPIALKAGVPLAIITAIAQGKRPVHMKKDESAVYDFSMELLRDHAVSDQTYKAVKDLFGEQGVIDLVGINGYFAMLAMSLNVARTPLPAGVNVHFGPSS